VFRENDRLFLVFECLHGSLLQTIRDHNGPFTEPEVRFIVSQVLEGLAFAHRMGFFHRDIKPENLLWSGDVLKIADFGLAREIRSRPPYTEYISTRWYRAPEIVLRHEFYNSPVDIWAVGAIMAELYTLKPLFQGSSETDQLFKICSVLGTLTTASWPDGPKLAARLGIRLPQVAPTPLAGIIPGASPEGIDLMMEMLRYDPGKRISAAQALQHPFFKGEKVVVSPTTTVEERKQEIAQEVSIKDEKTDKVPVRTVERTPPVGDKAPVKWNPLTTPAEEFDDIFDGIL
jgi:protein kinase